MIRARPQITAISAYALADLTAPAGKRLISLSQNESALPPSPNATQAAQRAVADSSLYPDPDWTEMRAAIADVHHVDPDNILCGAGSMELIGSLIRAYSGPETEVLSSTHAYALFRTAADTCGARYVAAPEIARTVSVDALVDAVTPATRIVCVANPGNPTGTRISRSELVRLRRLLPGNILLLIDEAYAEFADAPDQWTWDLASRGDTVIVRTFSKAYGLAGMRVGWGLFPPAIGSEVRKLLNPNNISAASQAGATAAMRDQPYMRATIAETARRRATFVAALRALGFEVADSHTNFVLIDLATPETAAIANTALRREGVILRPMGGYGLHQCLRATIGAEEDMGLTAEILGTWRRS